jgi:SAM-dependent methyltransferase
VTRLADSWTSGDPYERYVGRWSRLVAREFVPWLEVPPRASWLDIGCGTGALTQAVLELADPERIVGVDQADGYVEHARRRITDARAEFRVGDARALPVPDSEADAAVSGLVLNFVPEPELVLAELRRPVRVGGTIGVYVWDYAEGMELIRRFWDAAVEQDPRAGELDEGPRFPLCRPDELRRLFEESGLSSVETRAIDVPTVFRDFDDYWSPFLGTQGPAPAYVASLDEPARDRLAARLRQQLPAAVDGAIRLVARAWAVRATR